MTAIHQECFSCPLPDCKPNNFACPLNKNRNDSTGKGKLQIAPVNFVGKSISNEYQRLYHEKYRDLDTTKPTRKITFPMETLEQAVKIAHSQGMTFKDYVVHVLEKEVQRQQ